MRRIIERKAPSLIPPVNLLILFLYLSLLSIIFLPFSLRLLIILFIFLSSCPFPHTCQLCLPALSKLEFFSLPLRKIALSLKSVFPILSSFLLIRSHSMFMLALVIKR
jgi:hypothetical protein